jgi:hypothetical protein
VLEVVTERMFTEPSIMETITSVSKALHEYERAGGFAPPAVSEAAKVVPEESATGMEPVAVASALPSTSEGAEAPLPNQKKLPDTRSLPLQWA